ncbi:putative high-affinity sulfate transporter [Carex littledalei]|uniref:Putative high-affinity sulfate transporter n=1 Tax=Carex littledalei TaxID=544730 RepID=A0A833VGJ8_9POAL|nr:putative high-affinity sulfate transporter [Carex littledalei]
MKDNSVSAENDISSDISSQPRHVGNDNNSHGHKVEVPQRKNLLSDFAASTKELFFHDDPLYEFKDQPKRKKLLLGIQSFFPIVGWARDYNLKKFRGDFIAGLTIASLCIPQDIGYAKLANVAPQYGLYTSFVPPLIYAAMGSSRDIAIGPVAVVSLLLGDLLKREIDPKKHPEEYLHLAFTATFFAGITEAGLGVLRLGFIIEFLSHAAVVGFMAGAAITIALQQLKGLLGVTKFTANTDIVNVMDSVWSNVLHGWNWETVVIGMAFLAFLLTTKYIASKNKKLFWVAAIAPMISVIISTFCVYITRADKKGVNIVRHIDKGINPSSVHQIYWSGTYLAKGAKIGIITGMVGLTEAVAIGRTFATLKDYPIDGNKEMLALGVMNIAGSLTSCIVATGSFSRSAVNYMAGCHTAVSNIVMSMVVLLTLLVITPLFKYTPSAVIAAIIISAVAGLIDFKAAYHIWKVDKMDFAVLLGAFFGVIFKSVEIGLLVAVVLSLAKILLQVTRPRIALLGNLTGTTIYRNVEQYPNACKVAGVVILRVDSAIYFSNANYIKERILRWLRDEQDLNKEQGLPDIEHVIIEMSPVTDIDTTGVQNLEELHKVLTKRQIQLEIANPGPVVIEKLKAAKYTDRIGHEHIFLTVGDAVAQCAPKAIEDA